MSEKQLQALLEEKAKNNDVKVLINRIYGDGYA